MGLKKNSKPTAVCVLGSLALTSVLVCAIAIVATLALALSINSGWLPTPHDHRNSPLNPLVDAIGAIVMAWSFYDIAHRIFRKCKGSSRD